MAIEIAKPCLGTLIPSLAIAAITKADVKGFLLSITLALAGYWLLNAFQVAQDRDLFDKYEYKKDDEWVPFGVLDVTDTEKTEDSEE